MFRGYCKYLSLNALLRTRTENLLIKSQLLCQIELAGHGVTTRFYGIRRRRVNAGTATQRRWQCPWDLPGRRWATFGRLGERLADGPRDLTVAGRRHCARVQQHPALVDARHDRRLPRAQAPGELSSRTGEP